MTPLFQRTRSAIIRKMAGANFGTVFRFFVVTLAAILTHVPAHSRQSGPCYYPTIEYFVADADLVVRGVVTKGSVVLTLPLGPEDARRGAGGDPPPEIRFEKVAIRVQETLRRDPAVATVDPTGQTIEFLVEQFQGASPSHRWDGREMLLSLRSTSRWRPLEQITQELCPWIVRLDWGGNNNHSMTSFFWWAYDLSSNDVTAYDLSGTRVRQGAEVLAKAREAAAFALPALADDDTFYWTGGTGRRFADITPADQSDHYLYAPVDSRLETQARHWLPQMQESEHARQNARTAIGAIGKPHDARTVEMLKQVATTAPPAFGQWQDDYRWRVPVYDMRRWARRVLLRWQTPPGMWSESFEYRLPMKPVGVRSVLVLLVPVAIFIVIWRWRRWRGQRFGFVSGVLTTLMIVAGIAWVRSFWKIDEIWYGHTAQRHEIVSNDGRLQLLTIRHWDEPFPLAYGSGDRTGEIDRALSWQSIKEIENGRFSRGGIRWATGNTPPWASRGKLFEHVATEDRNGPDNGNDWPRPREDHGTSDAFDSSRGGGGGLFGGLSPAVTVYPFTFISIPWLYLVAGGALGPLSWLLASWRSKRRRFAGLCGNCGYDLRATTFNRPCPECGALRSSAPDAPDLRVELKVES